MKLKEYRIPMPLSLEEYRLGQRWTEMEMLKETFHRCSDHLTICDHLDSNDRSALIEEKIPFHLRARIDSSTAFIHKQYRITDQLPKLIGLFFSTSDHNLILDEYSWDQWPYTLTIIENNASRLRVIIQSYHRNNLVTCIHQSHNLSLFYSIGNEQLKHLKDYEVINIAERIDHKDYRSDEDPTCNVSLKKPHLLPISADGKWYEQWSQTRASTCVYKLIELVFNDETHSQHSLIDRMTSRILVKDDRRH
jgi:hypothetical protein